MIKINDTATSNIVVKPFFGDELPDQPLLNRKCCCFTLISEAQTIYWYFKDRYQISLKCLEKTTHKMVALTKRFGNVTVDLSA